MYMSTAAFSCLRVSFLLKFVDMTASSHFLRKSRKARDDLWLNVIDFNICTTSNLIFRLLDGDPALGSYLFDIQIRDFFINSSIFSALTVL